MSPLALEDGGEYGLSRRYLARAYRVKQTLNAPSRYA
jgi:hypothetical protein